MLKADSFGLNSQRNNVHDDYSKITVWLCLFYLQFIWKSWCRHSYATLKIQNTWHAKSRHFQVHLFERKGRMPQTLHICVHFTFYIPHWKASTRIWISECKIDVAGSYMFKVNNRSTKTICKICSKLTVKTSEQRHGYYLPWWRKSTLIQKPSAQVTKSFYQNEIGEKTKKI